MKQIWGSKFLKARRVLRWERLLLGSWYVHFRGNGKGHFKRMGVGSRFPKCFKSVLGRWDPAFSKPSESYPDLTGLVVFLCQKMIIRFIQ